MAKRLTDSTKWRNEWFRTLPIKVKADMDLSLRRMRGAVIMKMDESLASFQLRFDVTGFALKEWFATMIHFIKMTAS